jgi:hypothetical protein
MKRCSIRTSFVVAFLLVLQTDVMAKPAIYRNPQFGIALTIPDNLATCNGAHDSTNHGATIFLDRKGALECDDSVHRRAISIFASYNVTDDTASLEKYSAWTCETLLGKRCVAGPPGLDVLALHSISARADNSDGWTEIVVLAQGGRFPRQKAGDDTKAINYDITLSTNRAHFKDDLQTFRNFLKTLQLKPPS